MTGWRIGYIIADKQLVDNITKLNQITIIRPVSYRSRFKRAGNGKQLATTIKDEYQERAKRQPKR